MIARVRFATRSLFAYSNLAPDTMKQELAMSIEIQKPELERRVREGIQSGRFQDMDDFLAKALDALANSSSGHIGALDWSQCSAVESVAGKVSGAWVFRNTRMPVAAVFENLEDGVTIDELVDVYAGLTRDQVKAVVDFAARSLGTPNPAH
jgi:uncharacterized protein (DUF433 family)